MADYGQGYSSMLGQANAATNVGATEARPEMRSENIISRLNNIKASVLELNASVDSAAEKIVGPKPSPLNALSGADGLKQADRPQPSCFLEAISRIIDGIERCVEAELRQNVNRLHREF